MAFQTIIFILTAVNFFRRIDRRLGGRTILHTVVRDGSWAYGLIVGEKIQALIYPLNSA